VKDWHLAHPAVKPNYESSIPEWIWGLVQYSALSAATIKFSKEGVALSASSSLSPLLEVQF